MLSVWTFVGYSFVIWLTWGLFLWSNHNVYLWPQNFLFNWNFLVYIKLVNNPKPISGPRNWTIMSVSGARNMLSQKLTLVILGERNFMIRFGLSLNTIDISLITYTCDFWTIYTNVSKNLIQCTSVGFLGNGYSFKLKKPLLSSAGGTIFFSSFEVSAGWTTAASLTEVSYSGPLWWPVSPRDHPCWGARQRCFSLFSVSLRVKVIVLQHGRHPGADL